MPKESTIQHYTSSTTGSAPTSGNLASGELAINTADEKIFYKNHVGTVLSLSQTKDLSGAFAASSKVVSSFNGATGAVTFTVPLATTSLTGTASFNPNRFQVSATGNVDLLAAYQATGDTVITIAGSGIGIATSGRTDTLYNIGVTSFNGLTGNVSLTGSGAILHTVSGTTTTLGARLASSSVTGVASFNNVHFTVDTTGHVQLAPAFQATGDTVITVAGSGIGIVTSGRTDTLYNIGVTSFNGFTGAVQVTGSGAILHTVSGTTTTLGARLATTSVTGVASFNNVRFTATTTGHIDLAAAFQVTGDTVVAGSAINISTSGTTKTINNIGVTSFNGFTGAVQVTGSGAILHTVSGTTTTLGARLATTAVTGVASFNNVRFTATTTGHIDLAAAYQATGDTVITVAGSGIGIVTSGRTDTLYNIGVTSFNGFTGAVQVTGSGAILHTVSGTTTTLGARLASSSVTGVASFGNQFVVSAAGAVSLTANYVSSINGATGAVTISPAGSTGYIQYHTETGFSADNGLQYDSSSETFRVGSGLTHTKQYSTLYDNFLEGYGSNLRIRHATGKYISIGDNSAFGAIGNGTYILVSDNDASISLYAQLVWTRAPSLFEQYATFDQYVDLKGGLRISGSQGTNGQLLTSTGSGITWSSPISPAGSTGYIQYHTGAGFSADNGLYYTSATETLAIGSGSRHIEITPGVDCFVSALASSNLRLTQNAGNPITIGDFDGTYGGNNTYLEVHDGNSTISLYASQFNCDAAATIAYGLSASALFVSSGATFNSNVVVNGDTTLGNAASDTTTIYGTKIVNEGVYANGSLRTANISFANGQVQTLTGVGTGATGTTAIYFTNAPSTGAASVTMIITNGGLMTGTGMTAWGGNIKWPGGIKPVLSSSGIDVVSFVTPDAGSTIYGFVGGLNFT